jgi:predicted permease
MKDLWQDVDFGFRLLTKSLSFTITAVLLLGLGIGATTAVFSMVDAILLKPLPYPGPDRIVMPWNVPPANLNINGVFPWGPIQFHAMESETKTFKALGAFQGDNFNLSGAGEPVMIEGMRVSHGFFPALGVSPALGRIFTASEDQPGHEHEVLLSNTLWRNCFHSDPQIMGRTIEMNGAPYTVLGVMPAGFSFPHANEMPETFDFPREAQLWVPAAIPAVTPRFTASELAIVGRLQDGVSVAQAQAAMNIFATRMDRENPAAKGWFNSQVTPLEQQVAGDTRRPLLLMLLAVAGVLLIICLNLASLLLIRSIGRQREFSVRTALGASQFRIMRQLLTESLLLALAGGTIGILISAASVLLVRHLGPSTIPRLEEVGFDLRIFAFALAITTLTSILIGLAPAIAATRMDLIKSLKEGGQKAGTSSSHSYLRSGLVVFQIALSFVLVVASGLLIQTFHHIVTADGGFRAEHVLTFELSLPVSQYPDRQHIAQFYQQALPRLRAMAGVRSVAITDAVPMGGAPESTAIYIVGRTPVDRNDVPMVNYTIASPHFFATLETPFVRGRDFLDSDTDSAPAVTIINHAMARRFWPDEDAIGKKVIVPAQRHPLTVVGIVADIKHSSLREEPAPEMFVPYTQDAWPSMTIMQVVLRSRGDPDAAIGSARDVLQALDPRLPLAKITTLSDLTDSALANEKFTMLMLGFFGTLSLLLTAIGIYGVISYSVSQRIREIGIRIALGATRVSIFSSTLHHCIRLAVAGVGLGLAAALALGHGLTSYLYGVEDYDPFTFVTVAVILTFVALVAGFFPARFAASLDPVQALRAE